MSRYTGFGIAGIFYIIDIGNNIFDINGFSIFRYKSNTFDVSIYAVNLIFAVYSMDTFIQRRNDSNTKNLNLLELSTISKFPTKLIIQFC